MGSTDINTSIILKKQNKLKILRSISNAGNVTKNDVATMTGLTITTISNIMNELEKSRVICEAGYSDSVGGRKPKIYQMNKDCNYIIGVNVSPELVTVAISDIDLNIISKVELELCHNRSFEEEWQRIKEQIEKLKAHENKNANYLGIGITLPGIIDPKSDTIRVLPRIPGWEGVSVQDIVKADYGNMVFVDKDISACALSLKKRNELENENIVLVVLRGGIGGGVVLGGQTYQGGRGMAGEFGHITMNIDGPLCHCGSKGCLELYASDYIMIKEMIGNMREGRDSLLWKLCGRDEKNISIEYMIEAAQKKDALCIDRFKKSAYYIGIALKDIIRMYDPDRIIINSKWIYELHDMVNIIQNVIYDDNIYLSKNGIKIIVDNDPNLRIRGTLMLVYDNCMNNVDDNLLLN